MGPVGRVPAGTRVNADPVWTDADRIERQPATVAVVEAHLYPQNPRHWPLPGVREQIVEFANDGSAWSRDRDAEQRREVLGHMAPSIAQTRRNRVL
jgi:hypothetical protein